MGRMAREGFRRWRDGDAELRVRAAGATLGFAVPFLVVLGIFDSYFEQPDITAAIVTLALVTLAGGRPLTGKSGGGGRSGAAGSPRDPVPAATSPQP